MRLRGWFGSVLLLALAAVPRQASGQDAVPGLSLDSLLNTPVSAAAKYAQTISEAAGAVTIVTSEDIELFGYRTLTQVLGSVRGFYTDYDRNYTSIGVRGFGRPADYNTRLLLLIDGHVNYDGIWGSAPTGQDAGIDLQSVERIEIVRGPGSALYGTGAMFGVVNIVMKQGGSIHGLQVSAEGKTFGGRGAAAQFGHVFTNGLEVALSGFADEADGHDLFFPEFNSPSTHDGIAHALDWERRHGVLGKANYRGFTLEGRYSSRSKGIPTASFGQVFNDPAANTVDRWAFLELKYRRQLTPMTSLMVRGYYDGYWYTGDYPSPGLFVTDGSVNHSVGGEAALGWDLGSRNRLTLGTEFRRNLTARYSSPRDGGPSADLGVPFSILSGYIQDEFQITPWASVLAGLRHDDYSTTGSATTPRGALVIDASRSTTLKLVYGTAFRAPSLYEASNASGDFLLDGPLGPEKMRSLEFIWQQRLGPSLLGTASLYRYDVDGLIELALDPTDSILDYVNAGSARASGFEFGLDARPSRTLRAYASYSYQRARDNLTHQPLSNSPDHLLKAGASVALTPALRPSLEFAYESNRRTLVGTITNPFLLTNAHLEFTPHFGGPSGLVHAMNELDLSVRVDNLFGVHYANPSGAEHTEASIPQDGRTVSLRVGYRF